MNHIFNGFIYTKCPNKQLIKINQTSQGLISCQFVTSGQDTVLHKIDIFVGLGIAYCLTNQWPQTLKVVLELEPGITFLSANGCPSIVQIQGKGLVKDSATVLSNTIVFKETSNQWTLLKFL